MRYQDQLVRLTQKAFDDLCRAALAVPEDKRAWNPGGESRSVLSQMQEVATTADFFMPILQEGVRDFDQHVMKELARKRDSLSTVEQCIEAGREGVVELCTKIAEFPDQHLETEMTVPFGGGMVMSMADILDLPRWNFTYHLGQINQIQLMLGDRAMH